MIMAFLANAHYAQAAGADGEEKVVKDARQACIAALDGELQVTRSQTWGGDRGWRNAYARLSGVKNGSSKEYFADCTYDPKSQAAWIREIKEVPSLRMLVSCDGRGVTFDGLKYDLNTPGDYLMTIDDFGLYELNTRHVPNPNRPGATMIEAVAVHADGLNVEIYSSDRTVYFDRELVDVSGVYERGEVVSFTQYNGTGLTVTKVGSTVQYIISRPGYQNRDYFGEFVIYHRMSDNGLSVGGRNDPGIVFREGLAGSNDGNPGNDLLVQGDKALSLPASQSEIERFGASWRARPDEFPFVMRPVSLAEDARPDVPIPGATSSLNDDCTDDVAAAENQADLAENPDPQEPAPATGLSPAAEVGEEVAASPTSEPAEPAAPRARKEGVPQRIVTPVAPSAPEADVAAAAPQEPAVDMPPPADLPRGERLTQNGHYLTLQEDGNLCVYREADDGWVWCINNDPSIRYAETVRVHTTQAGQLIAVDAAGVVLYALPRETPYTSVGVRISTEGVLEVYSADGVLWSSAN